MDRKQEYDTLMQELRQTPPAPVSYTHLDVYKRQALGNAAVEVPVGIGLLEHAGLGGAGQIGVKDDQVVMLRAQLLPVSYTHLRRKPTVLPTVRIRL